jgi:hypothetical protein
VGDLQEKKMENRGSVETELRKVGRAVSEHSQNTHIPRSKFPNGNIDFILSAKDAAHNQGIIT